MDTYDSRRSNLPSRLPSGRQAASLATRPGGSNPSPSPSSSPISIRVALRGAKRYWWLVLALWAVGSAGIGATVYLKVRPTYRASCLLRVDPSSTDLYNLGSNRESLDPFLQTQVQLILSNNVLSSAGTNPKAAVLSRIQLAGDVMIELRKVIQVQILLGTYLIEVSMNSPDPHEASTLVNAVVDAFIEANSEWSDGATKSQIKNLETYLGDLKNQTEDLDRRWKELVARGDVSQSVQLKQAPRSTAGETASAEAKMSVDHFMRLQDESHDIDFQLAEAEATLAGARRAAENGVRNTPPPLDRSRIDIEVTRMLRTDPHALDVMARRAAAESRMDQARNKTRDRSDPAIVAAQRTLNECQRQMTEIREAKTREIINSRESMGGRIDPEAEMAAAEAKAQQLRIKQSILKKDMDKLTLDRKKHGVDSVDITIIRQNRDNLMVMQETVYRRLEQLRFEAKGEARIRAVNPAFPPGKPISDKRMQYLAMTPVGILGAVLGLIVLLEIRSGRVADTDVLSSRVRHEVFSIAPLPNIRPGDEVNDEKAEQRLARFVQSLDHLRVALCEGGIPGEGRCVMITSATGGEGKTTLSAHLAARCANAGTTTLLIDADMRRASLGRLLDVPAGPGLIDVLGGNADLDSSLITVQAGGFHFLSAGTPGLDPSRFLKSSRLAELIGRLRQTYDLVIIDTPPILPVADALIIGRWADGAVMAARFDSSRLPLVERANRQLAMAGIPVLGVVVNGVRGQNANYGNYSYSYNYFGRPASPEDVVAATESPTA